MSVAGATIERLVRRVKELEEQLAIRNAALRAILFQASTTSDDAEDIVATMGEIEASSSYDLAHGLIECGEVAKAALNDDRTKWGERYARFFD